MSGVFYTVLLVLLFLFWRQNPDIDAILWWCGFPFFRIINSLIASDTTDYVSDILIYAGNFSIILSDTLLMIGCIKFTKLRIQYKLIYGYLGLFLIICFYQFYVGADLPTRARYVVIFDVIPIIASIYALSHLSNAEYAMEKFFTIFWTSFQVGVFIFWILIDFEYSNMRYGPSIVISLTLVYLSHIFTTLGLIILTIAKRRNNLIFESKKHKKLEEELIIALEKAQFANEEKNKFLTNMSHELRTPLNAIIGFSESLKLRFYGELNQKQTEYVDNIYGGGELLLKLITDLLNLSNIEEGRVEIKLEEVNLQHLFAKTLPLLEEIVGHDNEKLIINDNIKGTKISFAVILDQIRTKQILINFVSNAVKYSDKNSIVIIDIDDVNDQFFRISVSDQGMGIAEDQYENIFKPFNRAGNDKSNVEGIGVGLSIAKNLIEVMKGKIGFRSEVGIGSTFWIDIPKSKQRQLPIS
ncbi:MAG: hypothetical protein JKY84_11720 [Emcibacteraceae bacterium]|nr:hypothetical protein [Emcibacteraceae bacterium]